MEKILIFFPNNINLSSEGFLQGFVTRKPDCTSIFITAKQKLSSPDTLGACVGIKDFIQSNDLWLSVDTISNEVRIFKNKRLISADETCIFYNYEAIKNVQVTLEDFGDLLRKIQVEKCYEKTSSVLKEVSLVFIVMIVAALNKFEFLFKYCEVYNHLKNSLETFRWLLGENKNKLKLTSVITSKLLDVILGVMFIYLYWVNEAVIIGVIKLFTQNIILYLKYVLNTLMDSPGGLKLNYNLNRSLAIFFFYHISLWRIFIYVIEPVMPFIFKIVVAAGVLGSSFQVALFSDMISFLTLHVYCLYVYASRLYKVQTYGLVSLWKLFLGRKYNPLRNRVDSFQYSHNQLFVGTLGFTVFLFLLPTTFLYYAVFTMFRSIILAIKLVLFKVQVVLSNIPVYVYLLWFFNSYKIRGEICIEFIKTEANYSLYANFKAIPISKCVKFCSPPRNLCRETKNISVVINNMIIGNLL